MITIEFEAQPVLTALSRLLQAGADLKPAYQDIGEYLVRSTKQRGADGLAPDGTAWAPLSPVTIERKGHDTPLVGESKRLLSEIHYQITADGVEVGSALEYAGTMHFGAAKHSFAGGQTPWGDIPAREIVGLSEDDGAAVLDILQEHLEAAVGG
ncbi:phage virion morphogenesis protein [Sedimenticola hydrogenitrophicus]|uniref:phage virion morphogenesis protein n=1 Tax=Sedimenticola hydrogenitrophicus TaxID=2967975 RepID=UPI0023AF76C2|nr:phage virion morphogenesis protein [Sedimenticola hydrogenitrophicus]